MWRNHLLVAIVSLAAIAACQAQGIDEGTAEWLKQSLMNVATTTTELNLDPRPIDNNVVPSVINQREVESDLIRCTTEKGQNGVCVKYYLCDQESKTVIEDGYTIIDIREGSSCPNFLDVCCQSSQVIDEKKTTSTTSAPTTGNRPNQRVPLPTTRPAMITPTATSAPSAPSATSAPNAPFMCGTSNPGVNILQVRDGDTSDRIYADYGEFPWMVAILKRNQKDDEWRKEDYIGGGSLIHPSVVLTAAHKLTNRKPEDIKIRAGEWSTTEEEQYSYQELDVARIVVHQNYFRPSLYNDAGLVFLREPVNLDINVAPQIGTGCLAQRMPKPDTICYSMGWGAENFANKNVFASILKKVKLPLVSSKTCESLLQKTRLGRVFRLHESLTCAGGEAGVDTCRGDGGSPLVCPINEGGTRFAIVGMVAYGIKCGDANVPGVYVNVPNMYRWVTEQMANAGLDSSTYTYT